MFKEEDLPPEIKERMRRVYHPQSLDPNRVATGVPGFDEISGGGFPRGQLILVLGEPGVGMTVFGTQFLATGLGVGENGVYVSLKDSKEKFLTQAKSFSWDFQSAEEDRKFAFLNWSPFETNEEDFSSLINGFLVAAEDSVKSVNAKRIVVDPIETLRYFYAHGEERKLMFRIFKKFHSFNATCMFTTFLRHRGRSWHGRELPPEEYLAQGTIVMQTIAAGRTMERIIQVERMPETQIDRQPRPYRITDKGIIVYPRESVI